MNALTIKYFLNIKLHPSFNQAASPAAFFSHRALKTASPVSKNSLI
jgi:hypothetical protein